MFKEDVEVKDLMIFDRDAIDIINSTPLFNELEKKNLAAISTSMNKAFFNSQVFRTDTEARFSVLNDMAFPTDAAKYYQCLREMNAHQCELINLLYEYRTRQQDMKIIKAEIEELREKLLECDKEYEKIKIQCEIEKKNIALEQMAFNLKTMKRIADGRYDELMMWDKLIKELEPKLIEQGIPIDDVNAHQEISYCVKFIRQVITVLGSSSKLSAGEAQNLFGQFGNIIKLVVEHGNVEKVARQLTLPERIIVHQNKWLPIPENMLPTPEQFEEMKRLGIVVEKQLTEVQSSQQKNVDDSDPDNVVPFNRK